MSVSRSALSSSRAHWHACPALGARLIPRKAPGSDDARLCFVRHSGRVLTHNSHAVNYLPLCVKKVEISALVRHPPPTAYHPPPLIPLA